MFGLFKKRYCLIVSGNRCGSTLLEFMLDSLDDTSFDYEFQWTDNPPSNVHASLKNEDFCQYLKKTLKNTSIMGSKLVVPPVHSITTQDIDVLKKIFSNLYVIHIGRKYFDSFLSKFRGSGHMRNDGNNKKNKGIDAWLQDEWNDSVFDKGKQLTIDKKIVESDLLKRFTNDKNLILAAKNNKKFMHVEYEQIVPSFINIAKFIESKTSLAKIEYVCKNPPTKKIPKLDYRSIISNYDELFEIANIYELKRIEMMRELNISQIEKTESVDYS